jgi:hypothetical protein
MRQLNTPSANLFKSHLKRDWRLAGDTQTCPHAITLPINAAPSSERTQPSSRMKSRAFPAAPCVRLTEAKNCGRAPLARSPVGAEARSEPGPKLNGRRTRWIRGGAGGAPGSPDPRGADGPASLCSSSDGSSGGGSSPSASGSSVCNVIHYLSRHTKGIMTQVV